MNNLGTDLLEKYKEAVKSWWNSEYLSLEILILIVNYSQNFFYYYLVGKKIRKSIFFYSIIQTI